MRFEKFSCLFSVIFNLSTTKSLTGQSFYRLLKLLSNQNVQNGLNLTSRVHSAKKAEHADPRQVLRSQCL